MINSLRDIDRLAGRAAMRVLTHQLTYAERHTIAHSEIGLALAEAAAEGVETTTYDLVTRATLAIAAETNQWRRDHGQSNPKSHAVYWLDLPREIGRPDQQLPPRVALRQVWAELPERHQEALWMLALHGNPQDAARAAGCTYAAMQQRIKVARLEFYRLWFDWETPPAPPFDRRAATPLPTHCGHGHEFTPENTRYRRATNGRGQKRACRACDAESLAKRKERAA